jgi:acid phosphatase family membrane protein YuiD
MDNLPEVIRDFLDNQILIICLVSWALAQIIKTVIVLVQEKRIAWDFLIGSGGMPSSHTATVTALATSIGLIYGVGSIYFSIAAVLAIIVIYDAAGVRQSVGQHSVVLNRIIKEFTFKTPRPEFEKAFREFVGHTPFQVFMGVILGIAVAWLWVLFVI